MTSTLTSDQPRRRVCGQGLRAVCASAPALMALTALLLWQTSCGATGPVLLTPPDHQATGSHSTRRHETLELRLIEGRPTGLLLNLRAYAKINAPKTVTLALMRQLHGEEPITLHTLALNEERWGGLVSEQGLQLIDQQLVTSSRYSYWLVLLDQEGEALTRSASASITWPEPASATGALSIHVESDPASIELSWAGEGAEGAVIFRREIGGEGAQLVRLALVRPEQDHLYVDADVKAGGVYAYRIALAKFVDEVPCFGALGVERFVSVPALDAASAPQEAPPSDL